MDEILHLIKVSGTMEKDRDERKWMELAVEQARNSRYEDDGRAHPRVGVVVTDKKGVPLTTAFRGQFELGNHAEFTALERNLKDHDLSGATVYTTLEPCTSRNEPKVPCASRLIERRVGRVVIGMLDPNQDIRGRGEWLLAQNRVQIGRFDSDLMEALLDLNRDFIREQQGLGFRITSPAPSTIVTASDISVSGTYLNKPTRDEVAVFVRQEYVYWPQSRLTIRDDNTWSCRVTLSNPISYHVLVAKINEDIALMLDLYHEVGKAHKDWRGRNIPRLPKGIRVFDEIEIIRR